MQKVTYKQLEEMMNAAGGLIEAESVVSYSEFIRIYQETLAKKRRRWFKLDEAETAAYKAVRDGWVKNHCPPVMYIGEGSSRAAFTLAGGKCLKIAINSKGVSQNKVEFVNTTFGQGGYSCFARNFAADKKTWGSIVVECCTNLDDAKLAELYADCGESGKMKYSFPSTFQTLTHSLLQTLNDCRFDTDKAMHVITEHERKAVTSRYYKDVWQFCRIFLRRITDPYWVRFPQYKVFADLVRFYQNHGGSESAMCVDDLESEENWGMAIRDGKIVAVVVDPGLSEDVFNKHYAVKK